MSYARSAMVESPELSYLCGVFLGDGTLHTYTRNKKSYISGMTLQATDLDFVQKTFSAFQSVVNGKSKSVITTMASRGLHKFAGRIINSSKSYRVRMLNVEFAKYLKAENFSSLISKYPREFLRGLFDSEGCISAWVDKRLNRNNALQFELSFYNTDNKLCLTVMELLKDLGIESTIRNSGRIDYWKVVIRRNSMKLFSEIVGFNISRKTEKLNDIVRYYLANSSLLVQRRML